MTRGEGHRLGLVTSHAESRLTPDDRTLIPYLSELGIRALPIVWDDPHQNPSAFDALLMRSVWDYHLKYPSFLLWLDAIESSGMRIWNEPDTMRWNSSKLYLLELREAGVLIPKTASITHHDDIIPDELLNIPVVLKPAISADSFRTVHVDSSQRNDIQSALAHILSHSPALLQEFLPEIISEGEYSFVFLEGEFTHAVLKRPANGDFRVQEELGGTLIPITPSPGLIREAQAVIRLLDPVPVYARVDGVRRGKNFVVMELELIEPSLYLLQSPHAARRLAEICQTRLELNA